MNNLNLSSKLSINEMQEIQGGIATVNQRPGLITESPSKKYAFCLAVGLIGLTASVEMGPFSVVVGYAAYASCYF